MRSEVARKLARGEKVAPRPREDGKTPQSTCTKGHIKEGIKVQKRKRKNGKIWSREIRYCMVCNREQMKRGYTGYTTVRISNTLRRTIEERAPGKILWREVGRLIEVGLTTEDYAESFNP